MKIKAYAKINLRLKVLGITENAYHELQMINCKVNLYDTIILKKIKQEVIKVDMPYVKQEDNLVYKIVNKMFEKYQLPKGLSVKITKKIPIGAGLAGGSTDAAAVINAIDKMYKLNLSMEEKRNLALEFGTDIVYCLENKLYLVEGIGDKVYPLSRQLKSSILIINPNFSVLTKDIFKEYDEKCGFSPRINIDKLEKMSLLEMLENDLEKVVFEKYKEIKNLKTSLQEKGYKYISMSGSGATIFVLGSKKNLKDLYKDLKKEYEDYKIYLTKII